MKQIEQNYRTGAMRVIDAPAPVAAPGKALVSTAVSVISAGTEKQIIELARASLTGKALARPDLVRQTMRKAKAEGLVPTVRKVFTKLNTPIPLGYSTAGRVLEAGAGSGVAAGDRVACAGAGVANHADFNAVPKHLLARIPDGVSDADASFVTIGAIALQGVRVTAPTLGERIVVSGLGLIGLLTVQILKANGCRVLGFDPNPERARLAREMGADMAVHEGLARAAAEFTGGIGADAVIVTASSSSSEPLNQAAEISRTKGRVVIVGLVGMTVDRDPFYKRELDIRLSMSYGPGRYDPAYEIEGHDYPLPYVRWTEQRNMEAFLELIADGRVTPSRLVTHRFPIERAEDAYALMDGTEPYLAILLEYPADQAPTHSVSLPSAKPAASTGGTAFIGFGNYAKSVLFPAYRKAASPELATVVTATGISAHGAAETFGFRRAATDAAEAIDDPAVSTVVIATRHDTHADLVVRALRAGKNVFVEKPLALTEADLLAVAEAAADNHGILMVGFNRRFSPMVAEAREAIGARAGPIAMTYRINAGYVPPESWLHGPEGGGRIIGEVCHFVDTLAAIAGSRPTLVGSASPDGIADSLSAVLRFSDGSTGTILYSSQGDPAVPKERIEIFANGCVVEIEDFSAISISRGGRTKVRKSRQDKGQVSMMQAFAKAIAGEAPAPIPLEDLLATTRVTFQMAGILP